MRSIAVSGALKAAMAEHARRAYPEECCGFLIAEPDPSDPSQLRTILDVVPVPNEFEGERRRRFLVRPGELRALEHTLEPSGRVVAGFYHSHPDHPARPSQYDQDHAWPWYTYIVLGVTEKAVGDTRAFELDPDSGTFSEVPLVTETAPPAGVPVARGLASR